MKTFLPLYVVIFLCPLLQAQTTWVVDQNGGGNFTDIQSAINASAGGDTILVEPGLYYENIDSLDKELSIISTGGVTVTSIISASSLVTVTAPASSDFTLEGFEVNNSGSGNGIYIPADAMGDFTIKDCVISDAGVGIDLRSDLTGSMNIIDCQFSSNITSIKSSGAYNGEVFVTGSSFQGGSSSGMLELDSTHEILEFNDCSFSALSGQWGWESIQVRSAKFNNCTFHDNYSSEYLFNYGGSAEMNDCLFANNSLPIIFPDYFNVKLKRCLFVDNFCSYTMMGDHGNVDVDNCTFIFNTTRYQLIQTNFYDLTIKNTIFWNNNSGLTGALQPFSPGANVSYSCIQDMSLFGIYGIGCIDLDPMFTNQNSYDLSLLSNSPCIDAGDPSMSLDPDGTTADMGAIYYDQSGSNAPQYTITNLVAGQYADFHISQAGANLPVIIGYSLIGPGPTATPYGAVDMSPPIKTLAALQSDTSGNVSFSPLVPSGASGITLYTQALCGGILSNSLALTTQ